MSSDVLDTGFAPFLTLRAGASPSILVLDPVADPRARDGVRIEALLCRPVAPDGLDRVALTKYTRDPTPLFEP